MKGLSQRGNQLAFGSFGIKTLENCWLTGRQIEAARQAVSRYMKREGKIWIRIFVKWLNKDEPNGWYSYQTFANEYDFTKNFELTLKKTQLKVTFDRRIPDVY